MNSKILSTAVVALALTSCDSGQNKAHEFVEGHVQDSSFYQNDNTIGRVVGTRYQGEAYMNNSRMYFMIDTNGDETAEYAGYIEYANSSGIMGVAHNAEVTHQKKTIAAWSQTLKDFIKIPKEKERQD